MADLAQESCQRPRRGTSALVGDPVAVEREHRDHRHPEGLPGRRLPEELHRCSSRRSNSEIHRVVVGDVHAHVLVALVGKAARWPRW